jgi:hypothetical protein
MSAVIFSRVNLLLPALVFGLWGCVIFRLKTSGLLAELQSSVFHPFSIGMAICCLLLAVVYPLVIDPKSRPTRASWFRLAASALLLVAPVLVFVTLTEDGPITGFLTRRYSPASSSLNIYQLLGIDQGDLCKELHSRKELAASGQLVGLDMLELHFIASNSGLRRLYEHAEVRLSGQWLADGRHCFRLVQMIMFCCAADAKVLGVWVDGEVAGAQGGDWLEVSGILHFDSSGVPCLDMRQSRPGGDAPR